MRCIRSPDNRMLNVDLRGIGPPPPPPDQNRRFRPTARPVRDYSRIKCLSCGEFGHMQSRCRRPDSSLPFKPAGWQLQSDNRPPRDSNNSPETLSRSGHHPHRSIRTSSGPFVIFIHHIDFVNSVTGNGYHN